MHAAGQRPVGLHHDVAGAPHVLVEVMVEHRGDAARAQQAGVVLVEIVGDEHGVRATELGERVERRTVATADGVDGDDVGVTRERLADQAAHGLVQPVRLRDVDECSASTARGERRAHGGAEADLALLLAAERAAAQRHQDVAGAVAEPLVDEVGGRGPGGAVVDADVGDPLAGGQVRDEGDDRDALWRPAGSTAAVISGTSGALRSTPCEPRVGDPVEDGDELARADRSPGGGTGSG